MSDRAVATVVYKSLPQYRVPFFEAVRPYLADRGVDLRLIYGQPDPREQAKNDQGRIAWALPIRNRIVRLGSRYLFWQPCLSRLAGNDLVILEQASKLMINSLLVPGQKWGGPRVAFWGHGATFNAWKFSRPGEAFKRALSRQVHWWFAYNRRSAESVAALGFPPERITVVQNTIETESLSDRRQAASPAELERLKASLDIESENVGLFVGGLYKEKRLAFLLEAALEIRTLVPDFHLLILGNGPEASRVGQFAARHPWVHPVGGVFGSERVPYFLISKVFLMPGSVGLVIIDSFALEVPIVTVDHPTHGPEIDYLESGRNGLMLANQATAGDYAGRAASLLRDGDSLEKLRAGCRIAAKTYTLEDMVNRFAAGVLSAIGRRTERR